ncbi:MAG: DUF4215 domain-containing protein [Deltaproteobacteria bacterium]|nr:DUF4215 domain-containing protein [Deltaproteobacteria bacterium]
MNADGCTACIVDVCGDGIVNNAGTEACDDGNGQGSDGCTACVIDVCGDGLVNNAGAEACDDANAVNADGCTACVVDICGDGIVNNAGAEACDDDNAISGDGCTACVVDNCGDGIVNNAGAEACDDGNAANADGCTACILDICGDGVVNNAGAEGCDDGNAVLSDGCTACVVDVCGDGLVNNAGAEACDDANAVPADGCTSCVVDVCGDSLVNNAGAEACDDGNAVLSDGCTACVVDVCGDGLVNNAGAEACDDGNGVSADGCTSCVVDVCGDGLVNNSGGEGCDDANAIGGDGCTECAIDRCGDGLVNNAGTEACDDGNDVGADGCTTCVNDICGDGLVNNAGTEACDDGNGVASDGCTSCVVDVCGDGLVNNGGAEACDDADVVNGDGCTACVLDVCGDGLINNAGTEACDDGNATNADGCTACIIDLCGDGLVNNAGAEQCDDGAAVAGDGCNASCMIERCGDGVMNNNGVEQCDDGGLIAGDGCNASCVIERCGDLVVNNNGEQCDDGNAASNDGCSATCRFEYCGDGVVNLGEQCDDGNTNGGDGCAAWCATERCGDYLVNNNGTEQCDDGNTNANDGCSPTCVNEFCGDGVVNNVDTEECDDGNSVNNDGCSSCLLPCGDGVLDPGEECDDGARAFGDGCDEACVIEYCGDSIINDVDESCDDGNDVPLDGCSSECVTEYCGDFVVNDIDEDCDDGNDDDDDGCSAACFFELCGDGLVNSGAEECDDGNAIDGDGCTESCHEEVCGDGIVNNAGNEACDDGIGNPYDGCDNCQPTTWTSAALVSGAYDAGFGTAASGIAFADGHVIASLALRHIVIRVDDGAIVAGTGLSSTTGVGLPAVTAAITTPGDVVGDPNGGAFLVESFRVRRIDRSGVITAFAFGGVGANGTPAVSASGSPTGLAIGNSGNVYVAEASTNRVRRIGTDGNIYAFAGGSSAGFSGDGGVATSATFRSPRAVAVHPDGSVWIADTDNHRIRRVSTGGIVSTVMGTGAQTSLGDGGLATAATIKSPSDIEVGADGVVLVVGGGRVRKIGTDGIVSAVAGSGALVSSGDGGPAEQAGMNAVSIALDDVGRLWIVDNGVGEARIRVVESGVITTAVGDLGLRFAGDGGLALSATLSSPSAVVPSTNGTRFIADAGNHRIRVVSTAGVIETFAGTGAAGTDGDGGPALEAAIGNPSHLALESNGSLLVATNNRIRRIAAGIITTVAGGGVSTGEGVVATEAALLPITALAVASDGSIYIAEGSGHRVRRVAPTGFISTFAGTGVAGFSGDQGPATSAQLNNPKGLTCVSTVVYIADTGNHRVRYVSSGAIHTTAGTGVAGWSGDNGAATAAQLNAPEALAFGGGTVFIADVGNERIRRIYGGLMVAYAGGGVGGEGSTGTSAFLRATPNISAAADGSVYFVRSEKAGVIDPNTRAITTIAGNRDGIGIGPVNDAGIGVAAFARIAADEVLASHNSQIMHINGVTGVVDVAGGTGGPNTSLLFSKFMNGAAGIAWDPVFRQGFVTQRGVTTTNSLRAFNGSGPDPRMWQVFDESFSFVPLRAMGVAFNGSQVVIVGENCAVSGFRNGGTTTIIAGACATAGFLDGTSAAARFSTPESVVASSGTIYISDTGNHRVRRLRNDVVTTILGTGVADNDVAEGSAAGQASVRAPRQLAVDSFGNVYVAANDAVLLIADDDGDGIVDGGDPVFTVYQGGRCLRGLSLIEDGRLWVNDACEGSVVEIEH